LIEDVSQLLRRLRNMATHEQVSPEFGRIRARLSTELLLSTADYFRILHARGLLQPSSGTSDATGRNKCTIEGRHGQTYYLGIDGDDTGRELERLFRSAFDAESFSRFSSATARALRYVAARVAEAPIHLKVPSCSGAAIRLRGAYRDCVLEVLRSTYARV